MQGAIDQALKKDLAQSLVEMPEAVTIAGAPMRVPSLRSVNSVHLVRPW